MADFGLDVSGQGAQTDLNLGNSLINNAMTQQNQAQLVEQAIEHTKQAKMTTALDEKGGLAAEKGLVPKAQAIGELETMLKKDGWEEADINAAVTKAQAEWPEEMNASDIRGFISALRESKNSKLGEGQPFQADGSQKNAEGVAYPKGMWLQDIVDTNGEHTYVQSAQPASIQAAGGKDVALTQKRKTQLVTLIATQLKAARGNWLSQGLYRCSTEAQRLNDTKNLTKQDLKQIAIGLAAVFTGGVPSEDEILHTEYGTKLNDILATIGSWTGHIFGLPLEEIRSKLGAIISGLNDELVRRFTGIMDFYSQGFQDVTSADPDWWTETRRKALDAAEHRENPSAAIQAGQNLLPMGSGMTTPHAAAAPTAGGSGLPEGVTYSVEE